MWKCGRVLPSPRKKVITRSWALGSSPPSWGLMSNTTAIRRSNPLSVFIHVISLTYNVGAFDEEMVIYLTIWTLSALENVSYFSFDVSNLGCVSGGRINKEILWCSDLRYFFGDQILFVDKYWQKAERMVSHHFWIWRRVLPYRVINDIFLVNCDALEYLSGDFRSGHLMR